MLNLKKLFFILSISVFVIACKKDENNNLSPFQYKLSGWYLRDTAIKTDGIKGINFNADGTYCWLYKTSGKDSLRCFGSYKQTTDSTIVWQDFSTIKYKIKVVDAETKYASITVATQPASSPLFGYYTNP